MNDLSPAAGWTDARIDALKDHYLKGLSASESSRILHVSRNAIIGKRERLGLRRELGPPPAKNKTAAPQVARQINQGTGLSQKSMKSQPTPPATLERLAARPTTSLGLPLRHADFAVCRWPIAGEHDETLFCCAARRPGRVYCDDHHAIAFNGKPEQRRRAA